MDGTSQAAIEVATRRLARDLGCDPSGITAVQAEAVEWNDSSLGCPQPGMMYMQVITPGYRVTLEHNGKHYTLHTDRGRRAARC